MAKSSFHQWAKTSGLADYSFQAVEEGRLYLHYKNIALNTYRWDNLPDGLESRHIERALFENGQAFFTKDLSVECPLFVCLPCSQSGGLNLYGEPTGYILSGIGNGKTFHINDVEKGVRILNNDMAIPTAHHIRHYAKRMYEIDKTIQANLRQQKFPYVVGTTKTNEFTMKNIVDQVDRGEPAVFVDKTLMEEGKLGIQALRTDSPYLIDKLVTYRNELEKELLTFLGLNSTIQKKERLVVDETNANNSQIEMNLDLGFKQRELACKMINEKFGLNITVEKTIKTLDPVFDTTLATRGKDSSIAGGENNGL